MKSLVLFLLLVAGVLAVSSNSGDVNIDYLTDLCIKQYVPDLCDQWLKKADTSNVLSEQEVSDAINNANTVQDTEIGVLKQSYVEAKERLVFNWNSILSLMVLVLEVIKTVYYLFLLFVLVHLPYWYVKLMVFVQRMVIKKWG